MDLCDHVLACTHTSQGQEDFFWPLSLVSSHLLPKCYFAKGALSLPTLGCHFSLAQHPGSISCTLITALTLSSGPKKPWAGSSRDTHCCHLPHQRALVVRLHNQHSARRNASSPSAQWVPALSPRGKYNVSQGSGSPFSMRFCWRGTRRTCLVIRTRPDCKAPLQSATSFVGLYVENTHSPWEARPGLPLAWGVILLTG